MTNPLPHLASLAKKVSEGKKTLSKKVSSFTITPTKQEARAIQGFTRRDTELWTAFQKVAVGGQNLTLDAESAKSVFTFCIMILHDSGAIKIAPPAEKKKKN